MRNIRRIAGIDNESKAVPIGILHKKAPAANR